MLRSQSLLKIGTSHSHFPLTLAPNSYGLDSGHILVIQRTIFLGSAHSWVSNPCGLGFKTNGLTKKRGPTLPCLVNQWCYAS